MVDAINNRRPAGATRPRREQAPAAAGAAQTPVRRLQSAVVHVSGRLTGGIGFVHITHAGIQDAVQGDGRLRKGASGGAQCREGDEGLFHGQGSNLGLRRRARWVTLGAVTPHKGG